MAKGSYVTPVPAIIPSCTVWLDAADPSTINSSSNLVSSWLDKSSNKNNATRMISAEQPSYSATGLNGKPALIFTLNKSISNASLPALQSTGFTIFWVTAQSNIVSGAGANLFSQGANLFIRNDPPNENNYFSSFIKVAGAVEPRVRAATVPVAGTAYIVSSKYDTTTLTTTVHNTGSTTSLTRTPADAGSTGFAISSGNTSDFAIGELLVFKRSLSASEITQIVRYLSDEWGIAAS